MRNDVLIVGAGPVGLSLALALSQADQPSGGNESRPRVTVIEAQPESALLEPAFDGREIALTHRSVSILDRLGIWKLIPDSAISSLREARVINGTGKTELSIGYHDAGRDRLGYLVGNQHIRQAAWARVRELDAVSIRAGRRVVQVEVRRTGIEVRLDNGERLEAGLLVAADSRFSETQHALGVSARMHDFGRQMLVCVMQIEKPHEQVAWEWFDHGQTLALLPMREGQASIVITLEPQAMQALMQLDEHEFASQVTQRFSGRFGSMRLVSTRHVYPLVTVWADRFVGERFALIGDAAVGMHPVTAHGFNLGLYGVESLRREVLSALAAGADVADSRRLAAYERAQRLQAAPLFLATHGIAKLFGREDPISRRLRALAIEAAARFTPFKKRLARELSRAY